MSIVKILRSYVAIEFRNCIRNISRNFFRIEIYERDLVYHHGLALSPNGTLLGLVYGLSENFAQRCDPMYERRTMRGVLRLNQWRPPLPTPTEVPI